MAKKWIHWFEELTKDSYELVGKKCANLGEMTRAGLPVPPGFALTLDGYSLFMKETGAADEIRHYLVDKSEQEISRNEVHSRRIREIVERHALPQRMYDDVAREYLKLCEICGVEDVPVAVRSSGIVSMPGQMETHLNVCGADEVADKIVAVWGSSFTFQALAYRVNKDLPIETFPIGVAVMKVVNAKCSGVAFSIHPNTGDRNKMLIEANWGLGEGVVGGGVTPDRFVVDRTTGLVEKTINRKHQCVVPSGAGTGWEPVAEELQECSCVDEDELHELVRLAEKLEERYGEPQDIEWVFDRDFDLPDSLRVVQTRPAKIAKGADNGAQNAYLIDLMLSTVFHRR
jgi:pyruvate, water dikinase